MAGRNSNHLRRHGEEEDGHRPKSSGSSLAPPPKNLFDYVMEQKFKDNEDQRKTLLHRLVVISKMNNQNFTAISQYYERQFKDIQNQFQCEGVTGLLLLYPKHCVHVIESSVEVLVEFVKLLKQEADSREGNVEKSRIMIISHDIPHRLYQHWSYRIIDIEAPNVDLYDPSESPERLVIDTLTQVLKLGSYIARQPKGLKNIDNLHEKVPEMLPQQVVIGWLLENDHENITIPLSEYIDKYTRPFDVTLSGETVWPMPVRLFPYN